LGCFWGEVWRGVFDYTEGKGAVRDASSAESGPFQLNQSGPPATASASDRYYVLGVLTLAYALNIADRFSISTLIEPIKLELHLSDSGVGYLTGVALALFYVTVGIPVALLADRANRRNILAGALVIWSGMTAVCGLSRSFIQLMFGRFGVGIGEAGGTAPSTSLLADKFPPARRPLALTIFALGACLGAWLGSSVAGVAAERSGWRAAFLLLGIPGLVLGLVVWLTIREPRRGTFDRIAAAPTTLSKTLLFVRQQRSALHLVFGGSVATLWSWGLMWWTPAFLQRSHHLSVGSAGQLLGPMHLIAGTASTLLAAWLMSRRAAADPRYIAKLVSLFVALSTVPSFFVFWVQSTQATTICLWLFVPGVYFYLGPIMGLLQNVLPANMRATGLAMLLFLANIGNLVVAPQFIGWLSDALRLYLGAGDESLRWSLLILAPTGLWAAWHLWLAARTIREDEARIG
jgi:predicted MFS family arabinose efflux permease